MIFSPPVICSVFPGIFPSSGVLLESLQELIVQSLQVCCSKCDRIIVRNSTVGAPGIFPGDAPEISSRGAPGITTEKALLKSLQVLLLKFSWKVLLESLQKLLLKSIPAELLGSSYFVRVCSWKIKKGHLESLRELRLVSFQ